MDAVPLYQLIFGTSPFPFWFTVNCIWACYVIHISSKGRSLPFGFALYAITSFLAVFIPREFYAFVMYKPSPISLHPASLLVHLVICALFGLLPQDLFVRLVSRGSLMLGLTQGAYQMRTLCFGLRNITYLEGFGTFICAALWATIDQLFIAILRALTGGRSVPASSLLYWLQTIIVFTAYWGVTHKNSVVPVQFPIMPAAIVFSGIQGLVNAAALVRCRHRKNE